MIPITLKIDPISAEFRLTAHFIIETGEHHFRKWLESYTDGMKQYTFHSEKGSGEWQKAQLYGSEDSFPWLLHIIALMHYPGEFMPIPVKVIEIEIMPLRPTSKDTPGRTEIKVQCIQLNWGRRYFKLMLHDIEKTLAGSKGDGRN